LVSRAYSFGDSSIRLLVGLNVSSMSVLASGFVLLFACLCAQVWVSSPSVDTCRYLEDVIERDPCSSVLDVSAESVENEIGSYCLGTDRLFGVTTVSL
jgi:hypothetical protein